MLHAWPKGAVDVWPLGLQSLLRGWANGAAGVLTLGFAFLGRWGERAGELRVDTTPGRELSRGHVSALVCGLDVSCAPAWHVWAQGTSASLLEVLVGETEFLPSGGYGELSVSTRIAPPPPHPPCPTVIVARRRARFSLASTLVSSVRA